jgi:hypothetical protein
MGRTLMVALALLTAIASLSCNSGSGMGMGVSAPTRWGSSGSGRPPVFVGGPS